MDFIQNALLLIGIAVIIYHVPYLIKRGWDSGKYDAHVKAKVCDACFRDIEKVNEDLHTKIK